MVASLTGKSKILTCPVWFYVLINWLTQFIIRMKRWKPKCPHSNNKNDIQKQEVSKSVVSICDSAGVIDLTRPHYLRVACRQHFLVTTLPLGHWGVEQGGVPKLLSLLLLNARYCQSLFFLWLLYSMQSKFDPFLATIFLAFLLTWLVTRG